jgi:hypothetical protein
VSGHAISGHRPEPVFAIRVARLHSWFPFSFGGDSKPANDSTSKSIRDTPIQQRQLPPLYDTSSNWEDWFSPEEYGDPWEYPEESEKQSPLPTPATQSASSIRKRKWRLEPLDENPIMDAQSRYLIRQLQLIYQDGHCEEEISSERCRMMIGKLLASAEEIDKDPSYKGKGDNGATIIRQRVMRAEAILRTMELFWDYIPDIINEEEINTTYNYAPRNQRILTHWSNHKPVVKWPLPTFEIYVLILRGLNMMRFPKQYQKIQNDDVAWICQDVVLRLFRFHKTKGILYLEQPPVEAFNQALATWANAHGDRDNPEKALHATQLLMDMKLTYNVVPDASSYAHVLRACAHSDENEFAKELGAKVALKFWKGVLRDELQAKSFVPTPFVFVFAIRALAGLRGSHAGDEVDNILQEVWEEARQQGLVNEHVLYELEQASTPLFQRLLQEYRERVDTHKLQPYILEAYDKSYHQELMVFLPVEWMEHTKRKIRRSREELVNNPHLANEVEESH